MIETPRQAHLFDKRREGRGAVDVLHFDGLVVFELDVEMRLPIPILTKNLERIEGKHSGWLYLRGREEKK